MEDSSLAFTEETILEDMKPFVYYIANRVCCETIGMEFDDVVSELNIEIIKGVRYYAIKKLNFGQIKSVLRRIIDNRVSELRYKYYVTFRKAYENTISIESELCELGKLGRLCSYSSVQTTRMELRFSISDAEIGNPVKEVESKDRVEMTRDRLSEKAKVLFDAVVYNDEFLITMQMVNLDKKFSYNKVAAILGIPAGEVKSAFVEIRNAYAEVLNV